MAGQNREGRPLGGHDEEAALAVQAHQPIYRQASRRHNGARAADGTESKSRHQAAKRLRSTCSQVFPYAVATARAERDIAADLRGALIAPQVVHRAAITTATEAGALLTAIEDFQGFANTHAPLRLSATPEKPHRSRLANQISACLYIGVVENDIFRALADPTRRAIFDKLAAGSMNASALRKDMEISQPAISQHLSVLRRAKLVREERQGRFVNYEVDPEGLTLVAQWLAKYRVYWPTRIAALKSLLKDMDQ